MILTHYFLWSIKYKYENWTILKDAFFIFTIVMKPIFEWKNKQSRIVNFKVAWNLNGAKNKTSFVQLQDDTFSFKLLHNSVNQNKWSIDFNNIYYIKLVGDCKYSPVSSVKFRNSYGLELKLDVSVRIDLVNIEIYDKCRICNFLYHPVGMVNIFCAHYSSNSTEKGI